MGIYVSLIIDVEQSKKYRIDERNEIQHYMLIYSKWLNELFGGHIKYAVTFSAGDELQGLFLDVTTAVMYFRLLEILLKPVKIRGGIGVGEWTVKIEDGISTQQDGPVYHRARRAITEVHTTQLHNIRISSERGDDLSNYLINASNVLKRQQIYKQNYVLTILELCYPFIKGNVCNNYEIIQREILAAKCEYIMRMGRYNYNKEAMYINPYEGLYRDRGKMLPMDPIRIDGYLADAEDLIRKRNMAFEVAEIMECTRQNADSIIKRGNANKIRELDFVALQYIENQYGG